MSEQRIILKARDCCAFDNQEGNADAIQYFLSTQDRRNVFQFISTSDKRLDESPIISFNYSDGKWYAGRYVGEAVFTYNCLKYQIIITPRFGNAQLYHMLEEIFNIRFSESNQKVGKHKDSQFLIKQIIAFLWLNMLSKANKHGLPRNNKKYLYKGFKICGALNVKRSIIPLYAESIVLSNFWKKTPNENIIRILKNAYNILKSEYGIARIKASHAANNALEQLFSCNVSGGYLTDNDYNIIVYKKIYKSFKTIVDLSWDIIKRKKFGNSYDSKSNGVSFFFDMAEIWELYLKNIIRKKLAPEGWNLRNDIIQTYAQKDFRRKLIPDIVFQKNDSVLVWDAKYKNMEYNYNDYDRGDFFQIHTYINYYTKNFAVKAGGLLYPLLKEYTDVRAKNNSADSIFNEGKDKTQYFVDGIDLRDVDIIAIKREEIAFLDRIHTRIKNVTLVIN